MTRLKYIWLLLVSLLTLNVVAQTDTIRYVSMTGSYNNNGRSWNAAKNHVQDAINDLREYLRQNNLTSGSVYIASGVYVPTESTEAAGGSMLNTSFKIYEGIHVYGGFNADNPEATPGERKMRLRNGNLISWDDNWNNRIAVGSASPDEVAAMWEFAYPTVLTGNHSTASATFTFDETRGKFNTSYPSSSYHVVWFGTNGTIETTDASLRNHYKPFTVPAFVDGCTIREGNASSKQTLVRDHTAYGGGVYMVAGTSLLHCIVERCNASIRGGGVYMDGGGMVDFCYVNTCQASGVGIIQGYGGAVCIDYDGAVRHSYLTQSCARIGGGLSICHVPGEYPWEERGDKVQVSPYSPYAAACVISNNTSNAEGGGVYLDEGGTVNHVSIVNNSCIGPDVTYYNRRHGRAGGIYVRNNGMMYNSFCWGNTCLSNNDIQFASVKQNHLSTDTIFVYHCAFMNHDITDWSGVTKDQVSNLEKQNLPLSQTAIGNYVCLTAPTAKAGVIAPADGVMRSDDYYYVRYWHPRATSAIAEKGVQVTDAVQGASRWIQHAHVTYGVVGNTFEPVSSLGGLVRDNENILYAIVPQQSLEAKNPNNAYKDDIPTLFLDPNFQGCYDAAGELGYYDSDSTFHRTDFLGDSWDRPLRNLGEAVNYFRQYLVEDPSAEIGSRAYYMIPVYGTDGKPTGEKKHYEFVQILVKPGVLTTAGPGNYLGSEMRTASVRVLSHMRLYAAYPPDLTGTNTDGRDPRTYTTRITANITGGLGEQNFMNNSAHVLTYINTEFTVVDGFRLYNANTHDIETTVSVLAGGGVLVNNRTTAQAKRIDMVGNELRNCVLANNFSPKGAGIYVNGEWPKQNGEVSIADLYVVNCVIRNNTAHEDDHPTNPTTHGIITANGRAFIDLNHCTIVNNVGYPLKADHAATQGDTPIEYHGFIQINNSVIFANGDQMLDNRGDLGTNAKVTVVNDATEQVNVFGSYNMFDFDIDLPAANTTGLPRGFQDGFTPLTDALTPRGRTFADVYPCATLVLPSGNKMYVPNGTVQNNKAILTRASRQERTYPVFENPSRNVGHSADNDKPLYGGIISYLPMNVNPIVNAANPSDWYRDTYLDVDRSDLQTRDFGGSPDIGAIENHRLPAKGTVLYVTPNGAGKRDGSSWANAIAGNTVYVLDNIDGAGLAEGDMRDTESNRILDSAGNPILTTNSKYNGGFAAKGSIAAFYTATIRDQYDISRTYIDVNGNPIEGLDPDKFPTTDVVEYANVSTSSGIDFLSADYNEEYPYGEQSMQSLSFWRSKGNFSPIDERPASRFTDIYNGSVINYNSVDKLIYGINKDGVHYPGITISNNRDERYVSGLQYAVEKASENGVLQVWVGNGIYTDYKGFVMRDSVTVLGGFPASTIAAPGLTERQALMADSSPDGNNSVSIPRSSTAANKNPADYETILQISDISPINADGSFNTAAAFFDGSGEGFYNVMRNEVRTISTHYNRTDTIVLSAYGEENLEDFTSKIANPSFGDKTLNGWTEDKSGLDDNVVAVYQFSHQDWGQVNKDGTNTFFWIGNKPLYGWSLSQTLTDLPAGTYTLKAWMRLQPVNKKKGVKLFATPLNGVNIAVETDDLWHNKDEKGANTNKKSHNFGSNNANGYKAYNGDTEVVFGPGDYGYFWPFELTFTLTTAGDVTIGVKVDNPAGQKESHSIGLTNFQLYRIADISSKVEGSTDEKGNTETVIEITRNDTIKDTNVALRKRVLYMPDVTMPNWSPGRLGNQIQDKGGIEAHETVAHTYREDGHKPSLFAYKDDNSGNFRHYHDVVWDGFTIRNGFIREYSLNHGGGAGVTIFGGATLSNCIVYNNINYAKRRSKGGGIFCDGLGAVIKGCFIINNRCDSHPDSGDNINQVFGGGLFMNEGTCFNTLIANNYSKKFGGGIGLCVGNFYNNTVAYNKAESGGSGLSIAVKNAVSLLFMANCIVYGNYGNNSSLYSDADGSWSINPFIHCYIQSVNGLSAKYKEAIETYGLNNQFFQKKALKENTPFAADYNGSATDFTQSDSPAKLTNDFRLFSKESGGCVNTGTETFEEAVRTVLQNKGLTEEQILADDLYQAVLGLELPDNDVAFADRVQDCQVDIGAYEYDGAKDIHPDTITHPGYAIYYITHAGTPNGNASADSPRNAACNMKLQKVLDAAGRYKYALMTENRYSTVRETPVSGKPDKSWTVQVRLAGDSLGCTNPNSSPDYYYPTRSTNSELVRQGIIEDNTLDYSFIVPHGVQLLGGYSEDFDERDPLTFRTLLSGKVTSNTGAIGQVYHVVTFTNALFDTHERLLTDEGGYTIDNQLSVLTDEADRAVLDGLFIEDGFANSPDEEDRVGAAAVVTDYAHIRNCVIQNNEALTYGGGLYLQPGALVSGTIVKNNTAQTGGGIYVNPDPLKEYDGAVARIFTTTISDNTASTAAGGLWFSSESVNLRANSIVLWGNTSNDYANVAGLFTAIQEGSKTIFPFTYSAVEVRQLEGQGNIELSAIENEGVRWDRQDPFDKILYFPIEMSSTLARSGMTYFEWQQLQKQYPTLDSTDIAGVSRTSWNLSGSNRTYPWHDTLVIKSNDFIDMGARAINKDYAIRVDKRNILRRLYVMHTTELGDNSVYARALQDNENANTPPDESDPDYDKKLAQYEAARLYSLRGSSFLNPFLKFYDALDYIAQVRKDSNELRDARFEIYLEHGDYEPGHNAYGESSETRTNTFTVPEGVTIVGGISLSAIGDGNNNFCQAGFIDQYSTYEPVQDTVIPIRVYDTETSTLFIDTVRFGSATINDICASRPMYDLNQNSVIEPWELLQQSRLIGTKSASDSKTNTYHVVTCFADSAQLGPLPRKYKQTEYDEATERFTLSEQTTDSDEESEQSKVHRTIIFDGVTITGGYANNIDPEDADELNRHPYTKKTYFRGGGIFVDGNWTADFDLDNHNIPSVLDAADHNIPLVIRNCLFQDNMAGNGGAIYSNGDLHIYSTHFTQNYSQGPINEDDAKYIPWTAGGCIATNAFCGVYNCLFANNEAKRGNYKLAVGTDESITDADLRQGFAGVISSSETSTVRAFNCNFVKNKAVGYPAIFNFLPNSYYDGKDHDDKELGADKNGNARNFGTNRHFAINCLFWGNRATADTLVSESGLMYVNNNDIFNLGYSNEVAGTNQKILRTNTDNRGVFFSAYEKECGFAATLPDPDKTDKDYRTIPVDEKTLSVGFDDPQSITNLLSYEDNGETVQFNHNVIIASGNNVTGGPNFVQPSSEPGMDGYVPDADWLISRVNRMTDAGWGYLNQDVNRVVDHWENTCSENRYDTEEAATAAATCEHSFAFPIYRAESAVFADTPDKAMYNYYSEVQGKQFRETLLPVGNQHYMSYTREGDTESKQMYRISGNPKLGVEKAYIDIGVYEYQYVQIDLKGNEIDTVWVAPKKEIGGDGTSWDKPIDDIQYAIDLLLRSANNHDKYVCLINDPDSLEFSPQLMLDNRLAYVVKVPSDGSTILLPDHAINDHDYGVRSLTFLGGWSSEAKLRDPAQYPTVISMQSNPDEDAINQLFVVEDMQRYFMQRTYRADQIQFSDTVVPVVFDGITFHNTYGITDAAEEEAEGKLTERGGAAIYYRFQRAYEDVGDVSDIEHNLDMNRPLLPSRDTTANQNVLPKLTISNCIFFDNGKRTEILTEADKQHRSPTVRIDGGGGGSLIVGSLFHSNAGSSLYAHQTESTASNPDPLMRNKVTIVNSTFALNDGHIDLLNEDCEMHNSLIWKDDLLNDTLTQLELAGVKYSRGTTHTGISGKLTHNAIFGKVLVDDEEGVNYASLANDDLGGDNTDVFTGPNFINPFEQARGSFEFAQRDFHLNPSVLTMNRADTAIYKDRVFSKNRLTLRRPLGVDMKGPFMTSLNQDYDLAFKPRLQSGGMERGAYECSAVLQRVLYVIPSNSNGGNGSSWERAFAHNQLQNAIDVAAVYTYMFRHDLDEAKRHSYVFVKGSADGQTEGIIHFREGVQIYGSIPTSFLDTAYRAGNEYTNAECDRYVNLVRASVYGVASPATTPTRVQGLHPNDDASSYHTPALVDGLWVTGNEDFTESPVITHNNGVILRNLVITDNSADASKYDLSDPHASIPVVDLRNGLLYNSLIYGNHAAAAVRVGGEGLVLNNTILTDNEGEITIDGTDALKGSVLNTLTLSPDGLGRLNDAAFEQCNTKTGMFAPYLTQNNAYSLPAELTMFPVLGYQLHEQSEYINAADTAISSYTTHNALWDELRPLHVRFSQDRDVLGNPRVIGSRIDYGCMETWYIAPNTVQTATNLTNIAIPDNGTAAEQSAGYTQNYGGNLYPHTGSVVYLMNGSSLLLDKDGAEPLFAAEKSLRPGYLLLQEGASLYGQGNTILANYLSVEKTLLNQHYDLLSLPFDFSLMDRTTTAYNATDDAMSQTLYDNGSFYTYNAAARAAHDYHFAADNSTCWQPLSGSEVRANKGVLMDAGEVINTAQTIRYNAFASTVGNYCYEEYGTEKIVRLEQNDLRQITTGAHFTKAEDMGWNFVGMPFLVSEYLTSHSVSGPTSHYQLNIPHIVYHFSADAVYARRDQMSAMRSWDEGSALFLGNAFLTQTSTMQTAENLRFALPYYTTAAQPQPPYQLHLLADDGRGDNLQVIPTDADRLQYQTGRDGVKWLLTEAVPQVYLLTDNQQTSLSIAAQVPMGKEIPVGVQMPAAGDYTFTLPFADDYSECSHVWLIDHEAGSQTDLLTGDYVVTLAEPLQSDERFALFFGDIPAPRGIAPRPANAYTVALTLYITNLREGDEVTVTNSGGITLSSFTATDSEHQMLLPMEGLYIVTVNHQNIKVLATPM